MARIIDDWGLRYHCIKKVEHVLFYKVPEADDKTIKSFLESVYKLNKKFAQ